MSTGKVMDSQSSMGGEIRYDDDDYDMGRPEDDVVHMKIAEADNDMISISHPWLATWDYVVMFCVAYSALTVPYEMAFLTFSLKFYTAQMIFNIVVSFAFAADCLLYFYIPFFSGHVWVYNSRTIKRNYLNGWFVFDFIGLWPWFLVPVIAGATFWSRLPVVLQMLRLFKSERIFRRIETNVRIYYSSTQLLYYFTGILLLTHWMACLWVFQLERPQANSFETESNWITAKFAEEGETYEDVWERLGHWRIYVSSFYWACMTVSTIGYGDIVPVDAVERMIASACMLIGAGVYGYVIGAVSSVVASRDSRQNHFHLVMDELNMFMDVGKVPKSLRQKLREFFRFKFMNRGVHSYNALLTDMSPALRSEVVLYINAPWVRKVNIFRNCPPEMITLVAFALEQEAYPPRELLIKSGEKSNKLYIIKSGVIASPSRIYIRGQVIGEECLSKNPRRRYYNARSMTYVDVYVLRLQELNAILKQFPKFTAAVNRISQRKLLRAEILSFARAYKELVMELERGGERCRRLSWMGDLDVRVEFFKTKLRDAGFSKVNQRISDLFNTAGKDESLHHDAYPHDDASTLHDNVAALAPAKTGGTDAGPQIAHLTNVMSNIYDDIQRLMDMQKEMRSRMEQQE